MRCTFFGGHVGNIKGMTIVILLAFLFLAPFIILFLLLGNWSILFVGMMVCMLIVLFSDYVVINIYNVRRPTKKNRLIVNKVKNISAKLGILPVVVYFIENNSLEIVPISCFRPGPKTLIVGDGLEKKLSVSELDAVIQMGLETIKNRKVSFLVTFTAFMLVIKFPLTILRKSNQIKYVGWISEAVRCTVLFLTYPIVLLEMSIMSFLGTRSCYLEEKKSSELSVAVSKLRVEQHVDTTTASGFARAQLSLIAPANNRLSIELFTNETVFSQFGKKREQNI